MTEPCIAFTGGGTGGHVYPGLAVAERLRAAWKGRIVWIGSGKAVEREAVEAAGIEFFPVPSGKLRRSLSARNLPDAFRVLAGFLASRALLKRLRPVLLFSKGGYVSVPPCYAAASLGIPVLTHESDVSPGLATRLNAKRADAILVSWDRTVDLLAEPLRSRAVVVGNPVRAAIGSGDAARGRAWLGFKDDLPVVLVLGGSQGARQVNELVEAVLPSLAGKARVAHQTGPGHEPARPADGEYRGFAYVKDEIADLYAAADVIVGRAGAGTLWEGAAAGKPMVFIPLSGSGTRGDQVDNARYLAASGAAVCLEGDDATPEALLASLLPLLASPGDRAAMASAAARLARPDAAAKAAGLILERIGKGSAS